MSFRRVALFAIIADRAQCWADSVTTHERTVIKLADGVYEIATPTHRAAFHL